MLNNMVLKVVLTYLIALVLALFMIILHQGCVQHRSC